MAWLLDTNVLSEGRKPKPEPRVTAFYAAQPLTSLHISVVNIAEIRFGIELVGEPNRRADLNDWLANKVRPMFGERVLQITEDIMLKWRLLVEEGRKAGHTFSQAGSDHCCDSHSSRAYPRESPGPTSCRKVVQLQGNSGTPAFSTAEIDR